MRFILVLGFLSALLLPHASFACRPNMEFVNQPFVDKVKGANPLFVGRVTDVGEDYVVFTIISPPQDEKSIRLPHAGYGTCGKLNFVVGETWIYAENDLPFGATTKLTETDLGEEKGADMDAVIQRVGTRLNKKTDEK